MMLNIYWLQTLSLDPLPYVRTQALSLIFTLLRDKPEQEHNLLRLLVNKLVRFFFPLLAHPLKPDHPGRY